MKKSAAAIATISLGIGLVGCGSDSESSNATTTTTTTTTTTAPPPTSPQAGANQTIDDYLQQNNIQATPVSDGTPGAPTVDLPVPPGWSLLPENDDAPYGGIVFATPSNPDDPAKVVAELRKLTGNVDTDQLLAAARGELTSMPGFEGGEGERGMLGGFPAYQIGGMLTEAGQLRLIAQKTAVIEGNDGVYLLQLTAQGPEADASALLDATAAIDDQTTITV